VKEEWNKTVLTFPFNNPDSSFIPPHPVSNFYPRSLSHIQNHLNQFFDSDENVLITRLLRHWKFDQTYLIREQKIDSVFKLTDILEIDAYLLN